MSEMKEREYNLSKLEDCCYRLRDAIIDVSLKFPEICTFKRYIDKIFVYDDLVYVTKLLHKCWCFAHPHYLTNTVSKNLSDNEMLEMALSKFKHGASHEGTGLLTEELDKTMNPLISAYIRKRVGSNFMALCYDEYLKNLHGIVEDKFKTMKKGVDLLDSFIVNRHLHSSKNLTVKQLSSAFDVFAKQFSCCQDTDKNRSVFLSLFDVSYHVDEGEIFWEDLGSAKGQLPSIASIYTIFDTLGIELNQFNKEIICEHICYGNGNINPEQIKPRNTDKQNKLRKAIEAVI